jgi:hypothetical protein
MCGGWGVVMIVRRVGRCLCVLLVYLLTASRVLAQGEAAVHGTVTASADGSAVPGAIVQLPGSGLPVVMKTTTTANGQFVFARLAPAEYVLTVTHADIVTKSGFTLGNRGSVSLGAGTAQRHNVGLEFGGHAERTALYFNLTGFTSDRFLSPPRRQRSTTPAGASAASHSWMFASTTVTTSSSW